MTCLPTFSGDDARRALVRRWGLPNAWPREGEVLFGSCRVLFVDDDRDGKPVAYWIPQRHVRPALSGESR
jgi:hypothetical protein